MFKDFDVKALSDEDLAAILRQSQNDVKQAYDELRSRGWRVLYHPIPIEHDECYSRYEEKYRPDRSYRWTISKERIVEVEKEL